MASRQGRLSFTLGRLRLPRNNFLYLLLGLVTFAYVFDAISLAAIPLSALRDMPSFFAGLVALFGNPLELFAIYIASVSEIFLFSWLYSRMKNSFRRAQK